MAKGNNKQRARKKHQKEKKRKAKHDTSPKKRVDTLELAARQRRTRQLAGWIPAEHGITGLATRLDISLPEAAAIVEDAQRAGYPGAALVWSPARVRAATDDQLLASLASLGITTDRASYLAATADDTSAAPHAAGPWTAALGERDAATDIDFVGLAAWELWRRWRPERPSREALLLARHRASLADQGGLLEDAIEGYLTFGAMLWQAFPDAKSPEEIDAALGEPPRSFATFHQQLGALGDIVAELGDVTNARRIAELLGEIGARFTSADPDMLARNTEYRAEILLEAGLRDEAMPLLRDALAQRPDRAFAYALLARAIAGHEGATIPQLQEALALIREGAENAVDAADWELDELAGILEETLEEATRALRP